VTPTFRGLVPVPGGKPRSGAAADRPISTTTDHSRDRHGMDTGHGRQHPGLWLRSEHSPTGGGDNGMNQLPDDVVSAVGRLTIAAADLEFVLAWIGADQAGGNAVEVLGKPGEPLRAARGSVEFAAARYREAFLPVTDQAAELLIRKHLVVRAMWLQSDGAEWTERWGLLNHRTQVRQLADPRALDELAEQIIATRDRLAEIVTAQANNSEPPTFAAPAV
jgi:hypothetical protein